MPRITYNKSEADKLDRVKRGIALITAKSVLKEFLEKIIYIPEPEEQEKVLDEKSEELVEALYDRGGKHGNTSRVS